MTTRARVDRERISRTLTFWLRPAFVLRVLKRFQMVAGFDRAIALASSTFTALIPLAVVVGAALPHADASDAAHQIIARYGLTGGAAKAVEDVFAPASGTDTGVSVLGGFLLLVAILSFSRGMQRLFEQTWGLKPLSVRNTLNDLIWIIGLLCYIFFSWWIRGLLDGGRVQLIANLVLLPASAIFLAWSGRVLSDRRIEWNSLFAVRDPGSVAARDLPDRCRRVCAASVWLLCVAVRRHRRSLGDDLSAICPDARSRRVRSHRAGSLRGTRPDRAWRAAPG